MKRTIALLMALFLLCLVVSPIYAYEDYDGNYQGEIKVDPPEDTRIELDNGAYIDFDVSTDGKYLTVTSKGLESVTVYLKGGDGYRIYELESGGEDLMCPLNNGGNVPQISHYGLVEWSYETPEETTQPSETTTTPTTTITETTPIQTTTNTTTHREETTVTTGTIPVTESTTTVVETELVKIRLPVTGENESYPLLVIGIILTMLGVSIWYILHKGVSDDQD